MAPLSPWVERWAKLVPPGAVLDLACGTGRHARHFAALGHPVLALDRRADALAAAAGEGIQTLQFDLEDVALAWPLPAGMFSGIVVTNYLHRPLFARLASSLAPDGVLIYETFSQGNELLGKPSNPDFLLGQGELLALAHTHGLRVIAFEDGFTSVPKPAMVQRLMACKGDFARAKAHLDPGAGPVDGAITAP